MVEKLPKIKPEQNISKKKEFSEYPHLYVDSSSIFGNSGNPVKSGVDIQKATLVPMADKDFLKTIQVEEIVDEDSNIDLLISI